MIKRIVFDKLNTMFEFTWSFDCKCWTKTSFFTCFNGLTLYKQTVNYIKLKYNWMISREMETYINFIWVHFYNVDFLGNRQNICFTLSLHWTTQWSCCSVHFFNASSWVLLYNAIKFYLTGGGSMWRFDWWWYSHSHTECHWT